MTKEQKAEYYKKWAKANKERIKKYHQEYYKVNKDVYLKRSEEARKKESYKNWRKQWAKQQSVINSLENRARKLVKDLLRTRGIYRPNCQVCGSHGEELHHFDYSRPYNVFSLCIKCHKLVHHNNLSLSALKPFDFSYLLKPYAQKRDNKGKFLRK